MNLPVVIIPIWILTKVKIRALQKMGLAAFLCLNVFMAVLAIVRLSGIQSQGSWNVFWQQMETNIAVTMVSLTAFRSLYVAEASRASDRQSPKGWVPSTARLNFMRKVRGGRDSSDRLPDIPNATMTGMRTAIREVDGSFTSYSGKGSVSGDSWYGSEASFAKA